MLVQSDELVMMENRAVERQHCGVIPQVRAVVNFGMLMENGVRSMMGKRQRKRMNQGDERNESASCSHR
jgi:hypothetical protein